MVQVKVAFISLIGDNVFNYGKHEDRKDGICMRMDFGLVDGVDKITYKLVYIHCVGEMFPVFEGKPGNMINTVEQSICS